MNRLIWPVTAVLAALILTVGAILSVRILHPGQAVDHARAVARSASAPLPSLRYSAIHASKAASTPETNPTLAMRYAENAVGNCIESALLNAGYTTIFDQYAGNGMVHFSTGTQGHPTGSTAARTLISVQVYTNSTVADNATLDFWGCPPFKDHPRGGNPVPVETPAGMQPDGPLDVDCRLEGSPYTSNFYALVDIYNPGSTSVTVSTFGISWGSNGILLSQQPFEGPWAIAAGQDETITLDYPPASATSCVVAGWNP